MNSNIKSVVPLLHLNFLHQKYRVILELLQKLFRLQLVLMYCLQSIEITLHLQDCLLRKLKCSLHFFDHCEQDWKRSVFIPIPKKGNAKECSNYCTIALISYASKVMLKILRARLQQYMNHELPDVQAGFRKGRATRDQSANIRWLMEKAREFQKSIYFCFIGIVNKAEMDVFLELSCLFHDPADVGNLISGSSAFSKSSLNIWKFTVHVLLKPGLENFEHYFTSV